MTDELARLPTARRISFQPTMAVGLTGSELILTITVGFALLIVSLLITLPLFSVPHISLLMGTVFGFAGAIGLRAEMIRSKRQSPEGYVQQRLFKLLHCITPIQGLIDEHGPWDCQRQDRM